MNPIPYRPHLLTACLALAAAACVADGAEELAPGTGICSRFLPFVKSMTFGVSPITCCMASIYRRLRVTSGAARYSVAIRSKRWASPSALAMRSAL